MRIYSRFLAITFPKILDALNFNVLLKTEHFPIPFPLLFLPKAKILVVLFYEMMTKPGKWKVKKLQLQKIVEKLIDWNLEQLILNEFHLENFNPVSRAIYNFQKKIWASSNRKQSLGTHTSWKDLKVHWMS